MGGGPSTADLARLQTNVVNLMRENEGLRNAIVEMNQRTLRNHAEAVIAVPIAVLGFYGIQRLFSMGDSEESGEERENQNYLLERPWRKIHLRLTEPLEIKDDFKRTISEIWPQNDKTLNILLLGQTGSGKPSFINACATSLERNSRIVNLAVVGSMQPGSITIRLESYTLDVEVDLEKRKLPVKLFDCRGLSGEERGVKTEDIKRICQGNIIAGYEINPMEGIHPDNEMYQENPQEEDKMHCIVYVLAADEADFMMTDVKEQLEEIKKTFIQDIPQVILLTKIDRLGIDITQLFRDRRVKKRCEEAAELFNFNVNDVFPQSSYSDEVIPCEYKDMVTLFNLRQ
ncbi:interferon-induced protein 44-like [Saccostrea cucullata]|uniref:interferon-induced protein 44-like n=1 Tax=Saccostrea cuccullata TaxID=36930 RepID=UPI002ED2D62C